MRLSRVIVVGLSWILFAACSQQAPAADRCEEAADHRAACVGEYVTPPVCDAQAEAGAEAILAMSCDQITAMERDGKADGELCSWLGVGCVPDEPIFQGATCGGDTDCAAGSTCLEGRCFAGYDSSEFTAIMDRWTKTTETSGSTTELLRDNAQAHDLRAQLIASAQQSIHLTALLIENDATGRETIGLLADAARRGVEVRVVIDATTQYTSSNYAMLAPLVDAGGEILPFNPITEWAAERWRNGLNANQRLHEKLLIVDGVDAIVGGRNVGDKYLVEGRWHDSCVHLTGPAVTDVQRIFLRIWDELGGWEREAGCPQQTKYGFACPAQALSGDPAYLPEQPATGDAETRPIYSEPATQKTPLGFLATLNLVRTARESIYIENAYFVPPQRLRKHLKAAVARGVHVVVVTNSLGSTDAWWMYYASLNYYKELIGAGIEVRQYRGNQTIHAKTMLVDGKVAVVGSFNLDPRSAKTNSEALVVVRDGAAVSELADDFAAALSYSDLASPNISAADWAKAKAFRLVEPLL